VHELHAVAARSAAAVTEAEVLRAGIERTVPYRVPSDPFQKVRVPFELGSTGTVLKPFLSVTETFWGVFSDST
jgi:hypothetical protein